MNPKDNKGRGRECGIEMKYFKMFRQRSVMIFSSYKDFSRVFWVKWGGDYGSLISASQDLMKKTNTFFLIGKTNIGVPGTRKGVAYNPACKFNKVWVNNDVGSNETYIISLNIHRIMYSLNRNTSSLETSISVYKN